MLGSVKKARRLPARPSTYLCGVLGEQEYLHATLARDKDVSEERREKSEGTHVAPAAYLGENGVSSPDGRNESVRCRTTMRQRFQTCRRSMWTAEV